MSSSTAEGAVVATLRKKIESVDGVQSVRRERNDEGPYLVATVKDHLAKSDLKRELRTMPTPLYVDVEVASAN